MKPAKAFFEEIKTLIHSARATVARGVDLVQVHTNFEIGRRIVEQEQKGKGRAEYGQEVMVALANRLKQEFGRGYSETNLKLMRLFYLQNKTRIRQTAPDKLRPHQIRQTVSDESRITQSTPGQSDSRPLHAELVPLRLPPRRQEPRRTQLL